jgi:hypothetical protein
MEFRKGDGALFTRHISNIFIYMYMYRLGSPTSLASTLQQRVG